MRRVSRSCVFVSSEAAVRRALGRARVGGTEAMLSARYRRAVAQALAALQQAAEASAPVIDLCGSQEADAAADIEGADPDDEVGEHFSARQVGAWIRTHEKDELADRWDWYERVQRALNGLVRDGRVHMGELGRFRLADAGRVTVRLTLRWDEREEMPIEVSSSCTDARLREIVSKKTGGRLPASKMRLVYPAGFDAEKRELGELPDDTVLALQIVKRATRRDDAAARGPPSGPAVRDSDPNASPIDEVVEHEAEGTEGWNDGGDGWVNLVAAEEEGEEARARGEKTSAPDPDGRRDRRRGDVSAETGSAPRRPGRDFSASADEDEDETTTGHAKYPPGPGPAAVFDSDAADELGALHPASALFSPVAAARAGVAGDDEVDEDRDALGRPRRLSGPLSADSASAKRKRESAERPGDSDGGGSVVDLTGAGGDGGGGEGASPTTSSSDSALSGSVPEREDDDPLRLHEQIVAFARRAGSDAADALRREATRGRVESCVRRVFPSARLACFGSGASGLALRGADIDLVVLGVGPECSTAGGGFNKSDRAELVSILRKIERALRRERVVARAQGIYTAKVPIVKAHTTGDDASGFALDLTVGATNGLKAVDWIKARVAEFPELRPLVLVLKKLLKTHGLDDASTGGCGGYLLVSLAVAHLRMRGEPRASLRDAATNGAFAPTTDGDAIRAEGARRNRTARGTRHEAAVVGTDTTDTTAVTTTRVLPPPPKLDLGVVVTSFLRRFGGDGFDYARSAVAANRASGVTRAADLVVTPGPYGKRPFILCEDPQEIGRNITASAYRFKEVRALFRAAHEAIAAGGDLTFLPETAAARPRGAEAGRRGGLGVGFGARGGFVAAKAATGTGPAPRWLAPGATRTGGGPGGTRARETRWTRESSGSAAGHPFGDGAKSPGKKKGSSGGKNKNAPGKAGGKKGVSVGKGKSPGKGKGGGGRGGGGRGWSVGD